MFIRYQTFSRVFKVVLWVGGIFLLFQGCQACVNWLDEDTSSTTTSSYSAGTANTPGSYALVQQIANQRATSSKIKDATKGQGWKINLYDDNNDGVYDRLKIDQNRDDNWDEEWSNKNGQWIRKDGATFESLSGQASAPQNAAIDYAAIEAFANGQASSNKVKDAIKGKPWKVNLYDDNQDGRYDRFKLDRNRDDVWDEAWTRKADGHWERDGDGAHINNAR